MNFLASKRKRSSSSIVELAKSNDVHTVRSLCKSKRKSLTDTDSNGKTALHAAAGEGHGGLVDMLLSLGADSNKRDINGWNSLHHACANDTVQCMDITQTLLTTGKAQVTALSNDGSSALHYFLQREISDMPYFMNTIDLMLRKGADINAQTKTGESPLHQVCASGKEELISFLLFHNAEPDLRTQ